MSGAIGDLALRYAGAIGLYQNTDGALAWSLFSSSGGSGWTDDGLVVRLTTSTDQVGIGTALPLAGSKLDVVDTAGLTGARFSFGVDRFFRIGTLDSFGREQLHFTGTDGVLRLGADAANGDAFNANSEGIVIYRPAGGDLLGRMKADRFGLSRASDSALYYFRVDETSLFYSANPAAGPVYAAGDIHFYVNRATGFVNINNAAAAGVPAPVSDEVMRVQGDLFVDGAIQPYWRKATDPNLAPAPTIYVRTTGNDLTGKGTPLLPYASVARALQALPEMGEYGVTSWPIIDVGPGTFGMPYDLDLGIATIQGVPRTVLSTYTVDATTPVNTKLTGNRIVLNTLDLAATIPAGTQINLPATAVPGGAVRGRVYRADNSGVGGRLVVWVNPSLYADPFVITVVAGATVEIYDPITTILACQDFTSIRGGYINDCSLTSVGGGSNLVTFDGCDFVYCDFSVYMIIGGLGWSAVSPYVQDYMQSLAGGAIVLYSGGIFANGGISGQPGSATNLLGEVVFLDVVNAFELVGGSIATWWSGGAANFALRLVNVTGHALTANTAGVTGIGIGGDYFLGDVLEARDLAGAVVDPFLGAFLVDVGAGTNTQVKLGAASSVTVAGTLNPVAIAGAARSTDTSGTYIAGGSPKPGPAGASYRGAAGDTAWSGDTDDLLEVDTTVATYDVDLPAANGVTPGCAATIKKKVTANDLTVTPVGFDTIDGAAGVMSYNAVYGPGNQGSIRFVSDGVSNWSRN